MKDYIVGISGVILASYVYVGSSSFARSGSGLSQDPAYYPRVLALILALLSLGLLVGTVRKKIRPSVSVNREVLSNIGIFLVVLIVYTMILRPIGFVITTALFSGSMIWFMGGSRKTAIIYALPISLLVYIVFSYALKVPLPKGILTFM